MKTKSNIFVYSQLDWAFGSINSGLSKYLFPDGFNLHLYDWNRTYEISDFYNALPYYDLILSCCDGSAVLLKTDETLASRVKFVVIIHSYRDLFWIQERHSEYMQKHITYTALCPWIIEEAKKVLPNLDISFTPLGIDTSLYSKMKPSEELITLGYAGARDDNGGVKAESLGDLCENGFPAAKKRSEMVFEISRKTNLNLVCATADYDKRNIYRHYTLMPGWYTTVDAICITSLQEGAGLPALEAAAAGRFVISTDVGHFDWHSQNKGGIMLPTNREEYIEEATKILNYFKNNPSSFAKTCKKVQSHALENYSWNAVKHYWIDLFQA